MEVTRIARLSDGGHKESAAAQFSADNETEEKVVNVYNATRQKILGFGGAFTDSAAYNYSLLSPEEKQKTLELLFGKTGLKYNFCRIPMASSDFSLYMYDNVKDGGRQFDITEDEKYKIPFISDALRYTDGKMTFFASPWSPPAFMKDNGDRLHGGSLMEKYYGDWADAFCAFIRGYERHSIKISAVTLQNEPHAVQTWESCVFDAEQETRFARVLKEKFKREGIDAAVLVWDHNKERLFERAEYAFENSDVDGAAFHWYSGEHFDAVEVLRDMYPEKLIIESEFCSGMSRPIGNYTSEAIGNLSHGANAITEWNLMLNDEGGPYHDRKSGCLAPVLLDRSSGKVTTTRVYDEMYMVSHFCGSDGTAMRTSSYDSRISVFACRRTDGKIAVCLKNNADENLSVNLRVFGKHVFSLLLEEQEAATLIVEE